MGIRKSNKKTSIGMVVVRGPERHPPGVPGVPITRPPTQRLTKEQARELGRQGGLAKKGKSRLGSAMGLNEGHPVIDKYWNSAKKFAHATIKDLALTSGGGRCGVAASSIVMSAAWQLACSRFLFETAVEPSQFNEASTLANHSRQNLIAAREICARDARDRQQRPAASLDDLARTQQGITQTPKRDLA